MNQTTAIVNKNTIAVTNYEDATCSNMVDTVQMTEYSMYLTCRLDTDGIYYYKQTLQFKYTASSDITLSKVAYGGLLSAIAFSFVFGAAVIAVLAYFGLMPVKEIAVN
jgi:hypothetical protein